MIKEHPILFSTPMVQAILEGRKTQTRRIIKPQPIIDQDSGFVFDGKHTKQYDIHNWQDQFIDDFSRWMPEDRLWVRETYTIFEPEHCEGMSKRFYYKASHDESNEEWRLEEIKHGYPYQWKPSIFMRKEYARIWLEITGMRVERLQEITGHDVLAEGCGKQVRQMWLFGLDQKGRDEVYRRSFEPIWKNINGADSWQANPWVWVIDFKVLSRTWGKNIKDRSVTTGLKRK